MDLHMPSLPRGLTTTDPERNEDGPKPAGLRLGEPLLRLLYLLPWGREQPGALFPVVNK
jgi:hypothetical protein